MGITWGDFAKPNTALGHTLSAIEDWTRYLLIPVLLFVSISSLLGHGPFIAGAGQKWFSAKILTYDSLLIIGVILRLIMHEWRALLPVLAQGLKPAIKAKLHRSIRLAARLPIYIGSASWPQHSSVR